MRFKSNGTIERRTFNADGVEARAANADGSIPFKGHAATFNRWANIGGYFRERIAPGAFAKTIGEADVRFLINHDPMYVLARNASGTLVLSEDGKGLRVEADMAPTSYANDLAISMQRGDVNQMSFAFRAIKETWDETKKLPERTVVEAQLADVSVVTFPAYEGTDAGLRSAQLDALFATLGLDEIEAEQRNAILLGVHTGDIAPEFVPVLRAAQERLNELVVRAEMPHSGDEPTEPTIVTPPAKTGNLALYQRRARLTAQRYGLAIAQ